MKSVNHFLKLRNSAVLMIVGLLLLPGFQAGAQDSSIDNSIARCRKGEIIVKAKPGAKVSVEQLKHEFWFGCAISNYMVNSSIPEADRNIYKEKFLENFNSAVTENALKWGNMERKKGEPDYSLTNAILEWTEANKIPCRGHNIFWGIPQFIQPWVKELPNEELEQTLKNRAIAVTSRYKGRFAEYDLNNEMIHGNYYEDRLGPDITKKMAEWSMHGDPGARLYLNDYDILTGNKLQQYMAHIRLLLKQSVPIGGIGVQGHLHGETFDRIQLKNALDSLAQFHLPIRVTEFNMPGQRSKFAKDPKPAMTPEEEKLKADELVDYYKICFAHPAVEGILMWGFWEGSNWLPASSLYKRDWTPTPAATAYKNLIFKTWWTNEKGKTNSKGEFATPAFFGKYKITVNGKTKEADLSKANGKVLIEF